MVPYRKLCSTPASSNKEHKDKRNSFPTVQPPMITKHQVRTTHPDSSDEVHRNMNCDRNLEKPAETQSYNKLISEQKSRM